jgi:hypothetical protein
VTDWPRIFAVVEQGSGPRKDEMFWVTFVAQQQYQYVLVLSTVPHPQERTAVIMDPRIVNSDMTVIWKSVIGANFSQLLAKNRFDSASHLFAALSAFLPRSRPTEAVEVLNIGERALADCIS